jgi:ABC-2 type transport system ATP-binding protein
MNAVEVSHISKAFGPTQAVVDVSFTVGPGEIFGLLGPNGAGKTTTIRIMLDLFKPNSGAVSILGGPMTEAKKDRIGYMPEERGLYQDVTVEACLVYLATLKGIPTVEARQRVRAWLERFDLAAHKSKKVKELSKGMQQKAQMIATIIHRPDMIIVDEPFASLDPVNTQLVKDVLGEMRQGGAAILMSTHQMHLVEEMCDRIVLIDHGRNVLEGTVEAVQRRFAGNAILVRATGDLAALPGVHEAAPHNDAVKLTLSAAATPQGILKEMLARDMVVEKFEIALPSLDEVFIRVVGKGGAS